MSDRYVILTGSKNNAGDFLIKYRAKQLLAHLRPDREIMDCNAWEPFTPERLEQVNSSKALILTGGPALQKHMRPGIYPMTGDLSKIRVPVIMMGIGWKSMQGDWSSTHDYPLTKDTMDLLRLVDESGYRSSVRDYHTLNVLLNKGLKNVVMTGCPALYSLDHVGRGFNRPDRIRNVSFSMGVSFVQSSPMRELIKQTIVALKEYFSEAVITVVFHHSIDRDVYLSTHNASKRFIREHLDLLGWLDRIGLRYIDISGTSDRLVEHYSDCDLHIGFRVHAHLFMNSISRPSVLISEDGRGKAVYSVISGLVFDGYERFNETRLLILFKRLGIFINPYRPNADLARDLVLNLQYERDNNYPRLAETRTHIDILFPKMKEFIAQLP